MRVRILAVSGPHRVDGIDIEPTDTVSELQRRVLEQINVAGEPPSLRFLFSGQLLQADRTLESYSISDGATIHMIHRPAQRNQQAQQQQQQQQPSASSVPSSASPPPQQQSFAQHTIIGEAPDLSHVLNMTAPLIQNALGSVLSAINHSTSGSNNAGGGATTTIASFAIDSAGNIASSQPPSAQAHVTGTAPRAIFATNSSHLNNNNNNSSSSSTPPNPWSNPSSATADTTTNATAAHGSTTANSSNSASSNSAATAIPAAPASALHRVHLEPSAPIWAAPFALREVIAPNAASPPPSQPWQQQQQVASFRGPHGYNGVPSINVHVHCSISELEELPERLERFSQRMCHRAPTGVSQPSHNQSNSGMASSYANSNPAADNNNATASAPPIQVMTHTIPVGQSYTHASGQPQSAGPVSVHSFEVPHQATTPSAAASAASSANHRVADFWSRLSVQGMMGLLMSSEPVYRQLLHELRQEQAQHGQRDELLERTMRSAVDEVLDSPDIRNELAAACRSNISTVRAELYHWCRAVTQRLCDIGRQTVHNETEGVRRLQGLRRVACISLVERANTWFAGGLRQMYEILMHTPQARGVLPLLQRFNLSASQIAPMVPMILNLLSASGAGEQPDATLFEAPRAEGDNNSSNDDATTAMPRDAPASEVCRAHNESSNNVAGPFEGGSEDGYDDLVDELLHQDFAETASHDAVEQE